MGCFQRFVPSWRRKRQDRRQEASVDAKHSFLELDDEKATAEHYVRETESQQSFLHLDDDKSPSLQRQGSGVDVHPAWRTPTGRWKLRHSSDYHESLRKTSPPGHSRGIPDPYLTSPPMAYVPKAREPVTPPSVSAGRTEVRVSTTRTRPLPTPLQPQHRTQGEGSRFDISPLQSSDVLRANARLPMSFLFEIDAKRHDQAGPTSVISPLYNPSTPVQRGDDQLERCHTVSPLPNTPTPFLERLLADSQKSSRNVSPISAITIDSPVITFPSATPVYRPRPFSKYNPHRPALEPAGSKNWPLENMVIPEDAAISAQTMSTGAGCNHVSHSLMGNPACSPTATSVNNNNGSSNSNRSFIPSSADPDPMAVKISHPELDTSFLADFHRQRRRQQKAKQQAQEQKRRQEAWSQNSRLDRSAKFPRRTECGIPPNPPAGPKKDDVADTPFPNMRPQSAIIKATAAAASVDVAQTVTKNGPKKTKQQRRRRQQQQRQQQQGLGIGKGLPPRLPSKSRRPSQSPDAYERARRISGIHELVGTSSSSTTPTTTSPSSSCSITSTTLSDSAGRPPSPTLALASRRNQI